MKSVSEIIRRGTDDEKAALRQDLCARLNLRPLHDLAPGVRRDGEVYFVAAAEPVEQDSTETVPMEQRPANVA